MSPKTAREMSSTIPAEPKASLTERESQPLASARMHACVRVHNAGVSALLVLCARVLCVRAGVCAGGRDCVCV